MLKKYYPIYDWSWQAARHIRHPLDRPAVMRELDGHIEDRIEAYMEAGLSHDAALEKALAAMGDSLLVGKQLAALHKPWLSLLFKFSKVFCLVCFLLFFNHFLDTGRTPLVYLDQPHNTAYNEFRVQDSEQGCTIYDLHAGDSFERAGYTMTITRAYVAKSDTEHFLQVELLIEKDDPWMDNADDLTDFISFCDKNGMPLKNKSRYGQSHGNMAVYLYLGVLLPEPAPDAVVLNFAAGNIHETLEIGGVDIAEE